MLSPPARHALRVPAPIHDALVSIAKIESPATSSNANDNMPGLSANLSRTVGTCTPHEAYIIPAMKKIAMVA